MRRHIKDDLLIATRELDAEIAAGVEQSRKVGRPSLYTEELVERICEEIAAGASLRKICSRDEMPDMKTILNWLEKRDDFSAKYARAREAQADRMDELIMEVAENCTAEDAHAARVKIDAYKWRAMKLAPKVYGDRVNMEVTGKLSLEAIVGQAYQAIEQKVAPTIEGKAEEQDENA